VLIRGGVFPPSEIYQHVLDQWSVFYVSSSVKIGVLPRLTTYEPFRRNRTLEKISKRTPFPNTIKYILMFKQG
jgi:hypothetical protein